jgi:choline-glycine betaine transporter
MIVIGPLAFMLFFVLMSPESRGRIGDAIGAVTNWIAVNRPGSYLVVAAFAACALLAFLLIVRWPHRQDEVSPLVQYRREHPDMDV